MTGLNLDALIAEVTRTVGAAQSVVKIFDGIDAAQKAAIETAVKDALAADDVTDQQIMDAATAAAAGVTANLRAANDQLAAAIAAHTPPVEPPPVEPPPVS